MIRLLAVYVVVALCYSVHAVPMKPFLLTPTLSAPSIKWSSCGKGEPAALECAKFEVPMDWSNPSGTTFNLSMARVRASNNSTRIGSVIFNPGGPGGSAIAYCRSQATSGSYFPEALSSHFDIVCPDPRGVGESNPVRCSADIWNSRQTLFPSDQAGYDQLVSTYKAFGESCLNLTGELVKYVDTVSVARDFEAIRVALHEGGLNYLGLSYGTQIGVTYAELYPQNIRSMALDGVLDHSASQTYFFITESETFEAVLNRFFAYCNETPSCVLHDQDVSRIFDNIIAKAQATPILASRCLPNSNSTYAGTCYPNVTAEEIRFNTQGFLLRKLGKTPTSSSWDSLGRALQQAANGDATLLSSSMARNANSPLWQGTAVGCLDWRAAASFSDLKYKQLLAATTSPHTYGASQSYMYEAQCAGWPIPITNPQRPLNQTALALTPPLLLVNAFYDPSTSYAWANSVKNQIPNGVLLTRDGDGHTSYLLNGDVTKAINAYLIKGSLPAPDTVENS